MKYVHKINDVYYYRRTVNGQRTTIRLTPVSQGRDAMLKALKQAKLPNTVADLLNAYVASDYFSDLAAATQRSYKFAVKNLSADEIGKIRFDQLRSRHVAGYLHRMRLAGHPTGGNRYKATLSSAYNYALRCGYIDSNPCNGVSRNTERPRDRLVSPDELRDAVAKVSPQFGAVLEFAAMTGLRSKDIRDMTRSQLVEEGIKIKESKRGREVFISWRPHLLDLVRRVVDFSTSEYLFTDERGQKWTQNSISARMRGLGVDWRLHDLRAFNASYYEGDRGLLPSYKRYQHITPLDLKWSDEVRHSRGTTASDAPVDKLLEAPQDMVGRAGIEPATNGLRVKSVIGDIALANQFLSLPLPRHETGRNVWTMSNYGRT